MENLQERFEKLMEEALNEVWDEINLKVFINEIMMTLIKQEREENLKPVNEEVPNISSEESKEQN